jgi:hypothetical protein
MKIEKGASAAVVVFRSWVNLHWVRRFLRYYEEPDREVRGDESHIILARVLDADDPHGLWIELNTARHEKDPTVEKHNLLVPWSQVLSIVIPEKDFSDAVQDEVCKIGFV